MLPKPFDLLSDGLRIIWAQRIIDGDKVIGAVIFNMEKGEGDKYGVVLRSSDLPLAPRPGRVGYGVSG